MNGTPLRVLVTSGGTSEPIDAVRKVTNRSTGRLGSLIADAFLAAGARVTYLCGESALLPEVAGAEIHRVESVRNLDDALGRLLSAEAYDGVIHAMAVSDYTPTRAVSAEQLAANVSGMLRREAPDLSSPALEGYVLDALLTGDAASSGKLSSDIEHLAVFFERTPKIIGKLRALQPDACLVGFKLLAGVGEEELVRVAGGLLARNDCDYVLANDQVRICGDAHFALLVGPQGVAARMETKQEIAAAILAAVAQKAARK